MKKNLWRRKCVRRAIFRTVQEGLKGAKPCATYLGSSYTKNEYSHFYQKFDADNFFEKSCIFKENRKKLFWGRV